MKYNIMKVIALLAAIMFTGFNAKAYTTAQAYSYIAQYKDLALDIQKRYGIPAPIVMAQAILESGAGTSSFTRSSNNHFGVKVGRSWKGGVYKAYDDEFRNGKKIKSSFRTYGSARESFEDYASVVSGKNYRPIFVHSIYDYRKWAAGLKKQGYATAPNYASSLIGLIEQYQLYKINGGVKLRGKGPQKIIVTRNNEWGVDDDEIIEDDVITEEQEELIEAEESYKFIPEINETRCTVLMPGETLGSIARHYDISPSELLKFNELGSSNALKPGDIIFLKEKKKKYEGYRDNYYAEEGETLYEVSQKFGVKVDYLAKLNNISRYTTFKEVTKIDLK